MSNQADGESLLRIGAEVRGFLEDASSDDPLVRRLLADLRVQDRVARWLMNARPIVLSGGISTGYSGVMEQEELRR